MTPDDSNPLLDELWPPLEPPADFADRVVAMCLQGEGRTAAIVVSPSTVRADSSPRRASPLAQWLLAAAVAAVMIGAPVFLLAAHPSAGPATAQAATEPDLGLVHD